MIRINLLPVRAAQKKEQLRGQIAILVVGLTVAVVGCGIGHATILKKVSKQKEEVARKEVEISQLKKKLGEVAQFKKKKKELSGKLEILDTLKEGKTGPVRLLDELSQVLPEKLWLTKFKESGGSVSLDGVGLSEEVVAQFLKQLEESPYYRNVELQVTQQGTAGGVKVQKFSLAAKVETPPKTDNN